MLEEEEKLAFEMRQKVTESPLTSDINFYKQSGKKEGFDKRRPNISNINLKKVKKRRKGNHQYIGKMIKSKSVVLKKHLGGYKKKYVGVDMRKRSKKYLTKKYLYQHIDESYEDKPRDDNVHGFLGFDENENKFDEFGIDYYVKSKEESVFRNFDSDKENKEGLSLS